MPLSKKRPKASHHIFHLQLAPFALGDLDMFLLALVPAAPCPRSAVGTCTCVSLCGLWTFPVLLYVMVDLTPEVDSPGILDIILRARRCWQSLVRCRGEQENETFLEDDFFWFSTSPWYLGDDFKIIVRILCKCFDRQWIHHCVSLWSFGPIVDIGS